MKIGDDEKFVSRWVEGLGELRSFVADKTPEWQELYTGIPADEVRSTVREIAEAAPALFFMRDGTRPVTVSPFTQAVPPIS